MIYFKNKFICLCLLVPPPFFRGRSEGLFDYLVLSLWGYPIFVTVLPTYYKRFKFVWGSPRFGKH